MPTKKQLTVDLSAAGNPDRREPRDIGVPSLRVNVADLVEASSVARAYIEKYNLGGGNWTGGIVRLNGRKIARVSYNGRVWEN